MNAINNLQMPRLDRAQRLRSQKLLKMEYQPSEIAEILGIHIDTIYRSLIPAGCPHRRDEKDRIWIVGTELTQWLQTIKKKKLGMQPDEAYCLHCTRPVKMNDPLLVTFQTRVLEMVTGTCPHCGTTINRARARENRE